MEKVTVIIPSRNEQFLQPTIRDILSKAEEDIEIVVILDGYWPDPPLEDDERLIILHRGKSRGMRNGINSAVEISSGDYIMKIDAHCMVSQGFDVQMKKYCKENYVCVPTRKRLNAEEWCPASETGDKRPDIDYLYVECPTKDMTDESEPLYSVQGDLGGKEWRNKNKDPKLKKEKIVDIITFQGSCWFMKKSLFYKLELMDEKNYGSFRKEPQEISFKCWLSGGRVVRNKHAWYAHLFKGNKYGRGYRPNKNDFKKGDEYNKKWLTDNAWDKQTKSFQWLVEEKFNDMPGWKGFFDSMKQNETEDTIEEMPIESASPVVSLNVKEKPKSKDRKRVKLYQNLKIEGEDFNPANPKRENSKFWNEGKYRNFIEPHIDEDPKDMAFVELGTNAGLFLKLSKDKGFKNVAGVEKDRTPVNEGNRFRELINYDYRLLKRSLGGQFGNKGNFDFDELPVADYLVMSTFHYYIDINTWVKFLDQLKNKARRVIIVSRSVKRRHWRALSDLQDVRYYFKNWKEISFINPIEKDDDPMPRNLWSICFESDLKRVPIDKIIEGPNTEMYRAVQDLVAEVVENENIDPFKTRYYNAWIKRKKGKWSEKKINKFVKDKTNLLIDIKRNGPIDPLIVQENMKLSDGGHRLAIMKGLGYKSVLVRTIRNV